MAALIVYDRFDNGYKLQADPRDKRQAKATLNKSLAVRSSLACA